MNNKVSREYVYIEFKPAFADDIAVKVLFEKRIWTHCYVKWISMD